jgi:transposase InsO family protein
MEASFMVRGETSREMQTTSLSSILKSEEVKQILCGVNHPQTNVKIEKWFDFYEQHRGRFSSIDELFDWYNNQLHGSLNMRFAETPNQALCERCQQNVGCEWLKSCSNGRILAFDLK